MSYLGTLSVIYKQYVMIRICIFVGDSLKNNWLSKVTSQTKKSGYQGITINGK